MFRLTRNNKTISAVRLLLTAALLFLSSCATLPGNGGGDDRERFPEEDTSAPAPLTGLQMKLMEGASHFLGAQTLEWNGKKFPMDCTGTVMAIYWYAGIDLGRDFAKYRGNGVTRIYEYLDDHKLLYSTRNPAPGDIIFWDNTYDANEDSRFNDEFTHMGMVVHVLENGTVEYVHENYRRGIVLERMNLRQPGTRTVKVDGYEILINSPIRARNSPPAPGDVSLAGELYRRLGKGWKLK